MTPLSLRLLKGGLVQMEPGTGRVLRVTKKGTGYFFAAG